MIERRDQHGARGQVAQNVRKGLIAESFDHADMEISEQIAAGRGIIGSDRCAFPHNMSAELCNGARRDRADTAQDASFDGVARLKERYPDVPVIPVFLQGAGKALPRGEIVLVPVVVDAVVGQPIAWSGNRASYTQAMEDAVRMLGTHLPKVFDDDD